MNERHYWQAKLVKFGPPVGLVTWWGPPWVDGEELDRSPRWQCLVRSETTARAVLEGDHLPLTVDGVFLRNIEKISESDYRFLIDHANFSVAHRPHNPDASPQEAVDVTKMPSIF